MRPLVILSVSTIIAALLVVFAGTMAANAATPTPSSDDTATPVPTPTYVSAVIVRIVSDEDRDGIADAREPGIAGVPVSIGCGDVLMRAGETNSDGAVTGNRWCLHDGLASGFISADVRAGLLPTVNPYVTVDAPAGDTVTVTLLFHDLGPSTMQLGARVIIAGLPGEPFTLDIAAPFTHCVERSAFTPLLYITSADAREGCPSAGAAMTVTVGGEGAGVVPFRPGDRGTTYETFVLRGDSMRFVVGLDSVDDRPITSARIGGRECSVITPSFDFPYRVYVIVLSDEARPGCGTPGSLVRFYRGELALDPSVPWRAGDVSCCGEGFADLLPELRPAVALPSTGYARANSPSASDATVVMLTAGALLAALGVGVRNRRQSLKHPICGTCWRPYESAAMQMPSMPGPPCTPSTGPKRPR